MEVSKLIETLRFCGDKESCCSQCPSGDRVTEYTATECLCDLMQKAANAIEELRSQLESHRDSQNAIRLEEKQATSDGWIPVTERLPDEEGRYMCNVKSFAFPGCFYQAILQCDKHGFREGNIYTDDVTHWMPLPEPPKEVE